jgi:hypothetical protein
MTYHLSIAEQRALRRALLRSVKITKAVGESPDAQASRMAESGLKASGVKQAVARMDGTESAEAEAPDHPSPSATLGEGSLRK